MPSLTGPWSPTLPTLTSSLQSMPPAYKTAFSSTSTETLATLCDPSALHVWESDSELDSLLQLTSVLGTLCDLGVRSGNASEGRMLIVARETPGRGDFGRICGVVGYLTGMGEVKKHLEGAVVVFGGLVVVVRGWGGSVVSGQTEAVDQCVKRINTALERVLAMGGFHGAKKKRKIVWHHGAVLRFLLRWIHTTTPALRSALSAISITDAVDMASGIKPSGAGRANTLDDLQRLEEYAAKLRIPVVLLDSATQGIGFEYLGTYMYFFAYYIATLLPSTISRPHLHKAQDDLVTFSFRLRAASHATYGADAVKMVQRHLNAEQARHWARRCVDKNSYTKAKCRAAGKDAAIHHAVQLADTPFALLGRSAGVPAFARLAVGPAATDAREYYTATPVSIAWAKGKIRPCCPAVFHVLVPLPAQDLERVTNRVQGLMMAVLERVRQEKGNPVLREADGRMWDAVVKACTWAIEGCEGMMPRDVADKVEFVKKKLKEGTWGVALNGAAAVDGTKVVSAVQHMSEPNRSYGFGMGTQQTVGGFAAQNAQQQQQQQQIQMPMQNLGLGQDGLQGGGLQRQMNGPAQGAQYAQQAPGQLPPPPPPSLQNLYTQGQGQMYAGGGRGQTAIIPQRSGPAGYSQGMSGGSW